MRNKMLAVCWVLFMVLALLLSLSGCGSALSAQQISSNTINNSTTLQTVKFTGIMQEEIKVTGGSDPGTLTMLADSTFSMDSTAREMEGTSSMSMYVPGVDEKQNALADYYMMGGWMYVRMSIPGEGDQWIKQKLSDDTWSSKNQIAQQAEILKTGHKITKLGSEEVDGVDCYIIQATPEINALTKLGLTDQLSSLGDFSNLDWGHAVKYYSVKVWISKDKFLLVKSYSDMSLEILPQDLGSITEDWDSITVNVSIQYKFYDHNKPVVIQLPPEAQNAEELPSP